MKKPRVRRTPPRKVADPLFPDRLHALIVAKGYSVSDVARRIGRSEGAVRKWIRGQSEPNVTDLILLAKAGIPASRLLGVS